MNFNSKTILLVATFMLGLQGTASGMQMGSQSMKFDALPQFQAKGGIYFRGKLVLHGSMLQNGRRVAAVARLNPDSTPDKSFGDNGIIVIPYKGAPSSEIMDVTINNDGSLMATGVGQPGFKKFRAGITRYGKLDPNLIIFEKSRL